MNLFKNRHKHSIRIYFALTNDQVGVLLSNFASYQSIFSQMQTLQNSLQQVMAQIKNILSNQQCQTPHD